MAYLKRTSEWFDTVDGPQLVVWDIEVCARPSFFEAWERLQELKQNDVASRIRMEKVATVLKRAAAFHPEQLFRWVPSVRFHH
ncbi:DUF3291 domain-containing protein [Aminobacter anthyllidis]|uniref:DUF3291 domain-containing protein n=1 Tax=Aminobacter anthyllidis TaxID=1035067 RepID=A0A9X1D6P9_9HYPH|nr:DUF3291 domain-containing protein [Aminobacter anthyllidis]